jgi:membrane-bound lytic murein transglycosylase D
MHRSTITGLAAAGAVVLVALFAGCAGQPAPEAPPASPAEAAAAAPAPEVVEYGREVAEAVAEATPELPAEEPGERELGPDDDLEASEAIKPADPETLIHEAMESYQSADAFWSQGALDDAFAALDHAYELMIAVEPVEGDPLLAQEKENLRSLISRRIVEIYASRQTAVGDQDGSIPRDLNDDVMREIRSFQTVERDFFVESYRRSGYYLPMIRRQLAEAGLPEQLAWLPLVESGFKDRALSSARALGLWQFIPSTGYRYGLDRSDWVDERMDPEKSTAAAIAYLNALHSLFGDWMTALAAYNCGERNVLRQIQSQRVSYFDRFWDLYQQLPRETRRYVPRFLATLEILDDPRKYGFDPLPAPYPALEWETVEIARATQLDAVDRALQLPTGTMLRLNPELRRNGTPPTAYTLRVPAGAGPTLVASLDSLPKWSPPRETGGTHRVRSGETLSQIAEKYRTSVRALMAVNKLKSANRLRVGQVLVLPGGAVAPAPASTVSSATLSPGAEVEHRVRSGDNLWILAARYGTTVERIRTDNGLSGNMLQPGQVLVIRASRGGA